MRIVYRGLHDGVEIIDSGQWAERDVPLDVDDDLAARLCEQDTWEPADPAAVPTTPAPAGDDTAGEAEEEAQP